MPEAFYLPSEPGRFRATELTRGPWDPGLQHAGPPAALLGRAVERHGDRTDLQVARVPRLPGPAVARTEPFFPTGQAVGYHTAMEVRFVAGSFLELGPATAWMRMRHPLVPGEPPSPLCRVLVAADSGNGVSGSLDFRRWRFINPDLTVYLLRLPAGEWVALEAATTAAAGIGLADTTLHDEQGPIGRGTQALFVDRR